MPYLPPFCLLSYGQRRTGAVVPAARAATAPSFNLPMRVSPMHAPIMLLFLFSSYFASITVDAKDGRAWDHITKNLCVAHFYS